MPVGALGELSQGLFDLGSREQCAEYFNLASQLVVRHWLDELLGGNAGVPVELPDLPSGRACNLKSLPFRYHLADQPDGLRFLCVKAAAGEQKVADDAVP